MVKARTAFITLSELIIQAAKRYGVPGGKPVYRFYCPMANSGKGADWLQNGKEAANPYLGASMPKCGELKETIPAGERKK
jgi:Cu(I)/Ag(I) efflux system membrane fusion protein